LPGRRGKHGNSGPCRQKDRKKAVLHDGVSDRYVATAIMVEANGAKAGKSALLGWVSRDRIARLRQGQALASAEARIGADRDRIVTQRSHDLSLSVTIWSRLRGQCAVTS
jgi:hypothetical protein